MHNNAVVYSLPWHYALAKTIQKFKGDYRWGIIDCCQFVSAYWNELTGDDYSLRFDYANKKEGYLIINQYGNLFELFKKMVGDPHHIPSPGDIVIVSKYYPAVFNGQFCTAVLPENGISRFVVNNYLGAWTPCHKS